MNSSSLFFLLLSIITLSLILTIEASSLRFYFEQIDNNKDDLINFTEWKKAYEHEEDFFQGENPESGFEAFRYSTMGDDVITWDEFYSQYFSLEKSNHTTPEQIHLSIRDSSSFFVIWITKYETMGVPIVNLGKSSTNNNNCGGSSLSTQYTGETYTYSVGPFGWKGYIHRVSLTSLSTPNEYYCYQVGNKVNETSQIMSEIYSFHTQHSSPTNLITRMAVYGDMGTIMPLGFAVSNQIIADSQEFGNFDLFQHAGDIAYAGIGGANEYEEVWDLYGNQIQPFAAYSPYMTTIGNHEEYYNCSAFLHRYAMPGTLNGYSNFYYSYNYGNAHIISMSTENACSYLPGSNQYAWLVNDLENANANRETTPWIFLFGHRPMYSSDQASDTSPTLQEYIEPLLKQYSVDLCIWGHMHEYERTYPVYNNTPTQTPPATSENPLLTTYLNPTSTTHLTIGTSGAMIAERWDHPPPSWSAFRHERYGYGQLTVYNSTHIEFTFNQMETREVLDDLWIVKNT